MSNSPQDNSLLPWTERLWSSLWQSRQQGRLPHALLIKGASGVGKRLFGHHLAQALLCTEPDEQGRGCGKCRSCLLFAAGSHPDYTLIEPEEGKQGISVDQIRSLGEFQGLHSQYSSGKVALVRPAEAMNTNAANALLKTLEEPAAKTYLILISDQPNRLLPTIRSRCQQWSVPVASVADSETVAWLEQQIGGGADSALLLRLSRGAPLLALHMAEEGMELRQKLFNALFAMADGNLDPIQAAESWSKGDLHQLTSWMSGLLHDMVRLQWSLGKESLLNVDHADHLQTLSERVDFNPLFKIIDLLQEMQKLLEGQLNKQLLIENLFLHWARMFGR